SRDWSSDVCSSDLEAGRMRAYKRFRRKRKAFCRGDIAESGSPVFNAMAGAITGPFTIQIFQNPQTRREIGIASPKSDRDGTRHPGYTYIYHLQLTKEFPMKPGLPFAAFAIPLIVSACVPAPEQEVEVTPPASEMGEDACGASRYAGLVGETSPSI